MDIKKLLNEPSAQARALLAGKIAQDYAGAHFTPAETAVAVDIFRILLKDIDKKVRKSLAEHLRACPLVPADIVLKLAHDESDVAVHVLEYSPILSEDDLIAIVDSTAEIMKLCAIARRDSISERLSDRLIATQMPTVLQELFANKNAMLGEHALSLNWDTILEDNTLLETLVLHGGLPLNIAEKLFFVVSTNARHHLARHYKLNPALVEKAVSDAREWELLGLSADANQLDPANEDQVEMLVDSLHGGGRLTHSMILRALCMGNFAFFEAGMAKLSGVARVNARILLMDEGALGFKAIYYAARMPEGFFDAVCLLMRVSLEESGFTYGHVRPTELRKQVIDRIYKAGYHRTVDNMDYLLAIIGGKFAATAYAD